MPDIRYVLLSDLHFGAENSVLTAQFPNSVVVDPSRPGEVMILLVECLHELLAANEDGTRPTLVLGGDVLELALAEDHVAAMVFERFIELVFSGRRLFADEIFYVPGNHDHHLWEAARERHYADYVRSLPPDEPLGAPWHSTRMLTAYRRIAGDGPAADRARAAQPRAARRHGADGLPEPRVRERAGVAGGRVPPRALRRVDVPPHLDAEPDAVPATGSRATRGSGRRRTSRGSTSSGRRSDVRATPADDVEHRVRPAPERRGGARARREPRGGRRRPVERGRDPKARRDGNDTALLGSIADHAAARERHHSDAVLSPDAETGLRKYVEGPVLLQLTRECGGDIPPDVSFLFGHTHKPFAVLRDFGGYQRPVEVANTGGWVVDTLEPMPLHGAAALLLDENLDSVLLTMYTQHENDGDYHVTVEALPDAAVARVRPARRRAGRQRVRPVEGVQRGDRGRPSASATSTSPRSSSGRPSRREGHGRIRGAATQPRERSRCSTMCGKTSRAASRPMNPSRCA